MTIYILLALAAYPAGAVALYWWGSEGGLKSVRFGRLAFWPFWLSLAVFCGIAEGLGWGLVNAVDAIERWAA